MSFGIATVTAITVICYLICEGVKATSVDNKFVPIIAGVCGAVLGVVGFLTKMSDFVGIVSGLAATGANQVGKQLKSEPKETEHSEGTDGDEV